MESLSYFVCFVCFCIGAINIEETRKKMPLTLALQFYRFHTLQCLKEMLMLIACRAPEEVLDCKID